MNNKTIQLAHYLIKKGDIVSPLRLQKMLFFMRYEEIKNNIIQSESYFKPKNNFEAWVNGPVNVQVYNVLKLYFWGLDEAQIIDENMPDDKFSEIDLKYNDFFNKWNDKETSELVDISHKNKSWIKARGNLNADEPSNEKMDESKDLILKFE